MRNETYNDDEIINMISAGGSNRKLALRFIFDVWTDKAKAIIMRSRINIADAEDAIQEALIVLDNNVRLGKYEGKSTLENYFIGICKGRIFSNKRSTQKIDLTDDNRKMDSIEVHQPETIMLEQEKKDMVRKMLNNMGDVCRQVLTLFKQSYSYGEIAEKLNLGNANNARQKASSCRGKLAKLIQNNPTFSTFFKN